MRQAANTKPGPIRRLAAPLIAGFLVVGASAPLEAAERAAPRESHSQDSAGRPAVTRSAARPVAGQTSSGQPTARDTRQIPPAGYRSPARSGGDRRPSHGGHRYVGVYPRYSYAYPFYPYRYWHGGWWGPYLYGPAYWWGYPAPVYGARYVPTDIGGLDLNVKPKKAAVYVDGSYVGLAKRLDGYPGYLWLEKGSYQVSFVMPGYKTVTQSFEVRPAQIIDVRIRLEPGESTPPPEVAQSAPLPPATAGPASEPAPTVDRPREELRGETGRLVLDIEPRDASVYLDGRLLGSGSELGSLHAGLTVEAGRHRVEVVRPGFSPQVRDVFVEPGGEIDLRIALTGL